MKSTKIMGQVRVKKSPNFSPAGPAGRKRQNGSTKRSVDSHSSRDGSSRTADNSLADGMDKTESSLQRMSISDRQNSVKMSVRSNESSERPLTKARVRTFLQDYYEDFGSLHIKSYETWSLFFQEYCSEDYIFIRPTGNPLRREDHARLFTGDMKPIQWNLVSIDSITIIAGGMSAIVVYTADQVFDFKGKINEDRAVFSTIIEQCGGVVKIVHEHRTVGRPIPKETRWE